ncbi:MAG: hypothetical protein QOG76_2004 [Pseudonocardiales bacterium]|nr:hypothetical protein [Pseudonocardiales bacterium]
MNLLAEFVPPQPPPGLVMNSFWQPFMTFVQIIPVVAVLWLGLRRWLPQDRALFVVCLLGGAATSLFEPVTDVLAGVWFAPGGMWVMFTTFNRPMPWFILPCYIWFIGGQVAYVLYRMRRGVSARQLWILYAAFIGTNIVMEVPAIAAGIYTYYGPQPFQIAGLPLWFQSINAAVPLVAAAAVAYLWPRLRGWRRLAVIAVLPSAHALGNAVAGWPMWSAVHSTDNIVVIYLVAAVSVALAVGLAAFAISIIVRPASPVPGVAAEAPRLSVGT